MAAELRVTITAQMTGLGKALEFVETFTTGTTPTAKSYIYQTQATTNTAEALNLGDVTTPELIILKAVTKAVSIDTSWVTPTHVAEIVCAEGEVRVFKPSGTVYIKNHTAGETAVVEALVVGT